MNTYRRHHIIMSDIIKDGDVSNVNTRRKIAEGISCYIYSPNILSVTMAIFPSVLTLERSPWLPTKCWYYINTTKYLQLIFKRI